MNIVARLFQRCRALRSDDRGTAVVELGLIAPMLAVITVGIVDLSNGVTRRMELSQAIHRTLEMAAAQNFYVSPDDTDGPDYSFLKAEAAEAAGVAEGDVSVTVWLECDGEEQEDYDSTCPATETTARYLQMRIDSSFNPSFSWVLSTNADGTFPLFAEAAVRIQ